MVTKPVRHGRMDVSSVSQCNSQNYKTDIELKDIRKLPSPIELVHAKTGKNWDPSSLSKFVPNCLLLLRAQDERNNPQHVQCGP